MSVTTLYGMMRNRLQSSTVRRLYWAVAKRDVLFARKQEEDFYRSLLVGLSRNNLIFDVGANRGDKTELFLRLGARVVAVEPDEACNRMLRDRFLRYNYRSRKVELVRKAVSDSRGSAPFWMDGPGSAVNTLSRKWADHLKEAKETFRYGHCGLEFARNSSVETTTIADLVEAYGLPFFIKIDVEGHELNVLRGMLRPVPFLSFEVNLSTFRSEGIECIEVLRGLNPDGRFNYTPDCCAGLVLEDWLDSKDFRAVLGACADDSIEVFWKCP